MFARCALVLLGLAVTIGLMPPAETGATSLFANTLETADDSADFVGEANSIATGTDGLGIIAYWDGTNSKVKVLHCGTFACDAGNTITTIDDSAVHTAIAIGSDGLPLVAYSDGALQVAHCANRACTTIDSYQTVDSAGSVGAYLSLVIGTDNLPILSYYDATLGDLKVAHCGNNTCSSGNIITTLDSAGTVGEDTAMAIVGDGRALISYYDRTSTALNILHCANAVCDSGTSIFLCCGVGQVSSIGVRADGTALIGHYDGANGDLNVVSCGNYACDSGNAYTAVDIAGVVGERTGLAIGADGLGIISYWDVTNFDLKTLHCGTPACNVFNTIETADGIGNVGRDTSVAIAGDLLPLIAYVDNTNGNLKVLHCKTASCSSSSSVISGAGIIGPTSMVVGVDGRGIISYTDNLDLVAAHCADAECTYIDTPTVLDSNGSVQNQGIALDGSGLPVIVYITADDELKVAHCNGISCSSATTNTVDGTSGLQDAAIAVGADGLPLISYYDAFTGTFKVAHCGDVACSAGTTITTVDNTSAVVGWASAVAIGNDGLGLISYIDLTNGMLKVLHCGNLLCNAGNTATSLAATGAVARTSVAIGLDGVGLISFQDGSSDLATAHCDNTACTSAFVNTVDSEALNIGATSLQVGPDGLPLIAYEDVSRADLRVAHCSNVTCSAATTSILDGGPDSVGSPWVAVAPTDLALISYVDSTNGSLKVAATRADHDGDGCGDAREQGSVATQGGLRNPKYSWDFYDVWTRSNPMAPWLRDRVVTVTGDILAVARRFGATRPGGPPAKQAALNEARTAPTSDTGYHASYDRGPLVGPNIWNSGPPDGAITVVVDVLQVARQFGHTCL